MTALTILRQLDCGRIRKRYEETPLPEAVITPRKFKDTTHNGLIQCCVACIELMGGEATKVSTTGRRITVGRTEVKGSGREIWIKGTTKNGTPDIRGTYNGLSLYVECKVGKDRQRDEQKAVEIQATQAGGIYILVRDFESFYQWITKL